MDVRITANSVGNTSSTDFPHHLHSSDKDWSIEGFEKGLNINIINKDDFLLELDLIGVNASLANALRRILIAEVPSIAIETVYIEMNTSVIQDEVLAHRLGLIPIEANPDNFQWAHKVEGESFVPTDQDTVVLRLQAKCSDDGNGGYVNGSVYSNQLEWVPQGNQADVFASCPIKAVHDNILIAKMRPGQEIACEMHCHLGIGKDHAKFSPVCTATYRLLPKIEIIEPITGKDAKKFAKCFPHGVIEVQKDKNGVEHAVVVNARKDTVSRECLRHDAFKDKVRLGRVKDHFIFSIESTGAVKPADLFVKALRVLKEKCEIIQKAYYEAQADEEEQE